MKLLIIVSLDRIFQLKFICLVLKDQSGKYFHFILYIMYVAIDHT